MVSTAHEPLPGWIHNFHGVVGVVVGVCLGVLRSLHLDKDVEARIVPADYVINNILAAAWDVEQWGFFTNSYFYELDFFSGQKMNQKTN